MSAAFETSQLIAATLRPGAPAAICCLASASVPGSRARIATSAPDAAYSSAIARPRPLLPPVTIALLPSSRISIASSSPERCRAGDAPTQRLVCRDAVDLVHVFARRRPGRGAHIGLDLLRRGRAGDYARHRRPVQQPTERELQKAASTCSAERIEALDDRPIRLGQIALGDARGRGEAGARR